MAITELAGSAAGAASAETPGASRGMLKVLACSQQSPVRDDSLLSALLEGWRWLRVPVVGASPSFSQPGQVGQFDVRTQFHIKRKQLTSA
jgi:hypothetical protein